MIPLTRSLPGRVLLFLGPSTGGIRRHVAHLGEQLRSRGWAVEVAGPEGVLDGLGPLDHVVDVPAGAAPRAAMAARAALAPLVRGVDVVHAHGLKAGWLAASLGRRPPLVVTVHNLVLDEGAGAAAPLLRTLEGRLLARTDATLAVSTEIARAFTGLPGAGRTRVVAPTSPVPVAGRPPAEVRAQLGVGPGQHLVVSVARLHVQKGLDTLLDAAAILVGRGAGIRVAIVGQGPLDGELRRRAHELGLDDVVCFAGPSSCPADEMTAADVVVLPSRWEGWPLVLYEAMRLGCPVVATAVGGVPDMVSDGVTGRLVAVEDPAALADAIEAVVSDPAGAARRARAATRLLDERYRPAELVERVEATYLDVRRSP